MKNTSSLTNSKMSGQLFRVDKCFLMFIKDGNYLLYAIQISYLILFFIYIYFEVNYVNKFSDFVSKEVHRYMSFFLNDKRAWRWYNYHQCLKNWNGIFRNLVCVSEYSCSPKVNFLIKWMLFWCTPKLCWFVSAVYLSVLVMNE